MESVLERVLLVHKPVKSVQEKVQQYDDWCEEFDKDAKQLEYSAPNEAVKLLREVIQKNGSKLTGMKKIVDFAAGSGLVGELLRDAGFKGEIVAQDGSSGMLEVAKKKGIYKNFYCCLLEPDKDLPLPLDEYDVGFITGALSDNQVHFSCIEIMLKHIKSGGLLIFTTRSNASNLHFHAGLKQEMARLVDKHLCKFLTVRESENFERATSVEEAVKADNEPFPYIPGATYCYKKL